MPNPTLSLSTFSGAGRADFTLELDAPSITAAPSHGGGVLRLPFSAKPDEVGFGESIVAVQGRLVIAESAANNPGIQIPMQTWYPNRTTVEVPLTFTDMARAELARKSDDVTCLVDLAAIANVVHRPFPSAGFERVRLVELPVASGAVGPQWAECMRLLARATGELRSGQSETAVATCREVVEGVTTVFAQQWGVQVAPRDKMHERLRELEGRMGAAWPDDKAAGEMLAGLYSAVWSWTSGEHHYGSRVPRHEEAEFAIGLTAALLTHAGHLMQAHLAPLKAPTSTKAASSPAPAPSS